MRKKLETAQGRGPLAGPRGTARTPANTPSSRPAEAGGSGVAAGWPPAFPGRSPPGWLSPPRGAPHGVPARSARPLLAAAILSLELPRRPPAFCPGPPDGRWARRRREPGDPHAQPEVGGGEPSQAACCPVPQAGGPRDAAFSASEARGVEPPGWMARLPLGCLSYLIVHSVSLPLSRFTSHQMQSTVVDSAQKWQFRGKG